MFKNIEFMGIICDYVIVLCARFASEYVRRMLQLRVVQVLIIPSTARAFRILHHLVHGGSKRPSRASEKWEEFALRPLRDLCIVQDGQVRFEVEGEYAVPHKGIVSTVVGWCFTKPRWCRGCDKPSGRALEGLVTP